MRRVLGSALAGGGTQGLVQGQAPAVQSLAQNLAQSLAQGLGRCLETETDLAGQPEETLRVLACPYRNDYNPYTALLYDNLRASDPHLRVDAFRMWRAVVKQYHIVHLHWPEFHFTHWRAWPKQACISCLMLFGLAWMKLRGTKVVWTAHNLGGHERGQSPLADLFRKLFQNMVDGVIFLSRSSRREFQAQNGGSRVSAAVIPHGHYKDVLARPARPKRDEGPRTLLYFGQIRPYKNVEGLLRAFAQADVPGWRLVVAGRPLNAAMQERVSALARGNPDIQLHLDFLPEDELERLVAGADLVVLPYKRILNSGSVLYALSLGKPVLGPGQGSLPEIQEQVGRDWLRLYHGNLDADTLASRLRGHTAPHPADQPPLAWADWSAIAADTRAFYLRLCFTGD